MKKLPEHPVFRAITGTFSLAAVVMLSACGGGTSAPEVSRIMVMNQASSAIARYEMQQQGGAMLQQATWACGVASQCEISTSQRSSEPVKLRFYDRQNKLLTAYELPELSQDHAHVITSDAMMGTQIFDELQKKFSYTIPDLTARLDHFFMEIDSADGSIDFFQELGQYFQAQVHGAGMTEEAFLDSLNTALLNHQVLAAPVARRLRSSAYSSGTDSLVCTKGGELAVDVVSEAIGEIPFVGAIFGTLFKGLVNSGCATAEEVLSGKLDDISGQLNRMSAQLNELASKMDSLGIRIDKLGDMLNDSIIQARINDFNKDFAALKRAVDVYNGVIYANKSLSGYVKAVGGLNQQNLAKYPRLADLLNSDNVLAQRNLYESMMDRDNLNSLASALVNKCANPNAISGDAIQVRQYCLYVVATMTTKAMLIQSSAAAMLVDKMGVLGAAMRDSTSEEYKNWLRGNFYTIVGIEDVQARRDDIGRIFNTGSINLGNALTPGGQLVVPLPLQDFTHPNFLQRLKELGCTFGPNQGNRVAVLQWMPKDKEVLLQCQYQGQDVWSKISYGWIDSLSSAVFTSMGVPLGPFTFASPKWLESQAKFFTVASSASAADNGERPRKIDFYADPQRLLLVGTRRLNLEPSTTSAGYYATDWSSTFEDASYTKNIYVRFTGRPVNGFALSHVFVAGFRYSKEGADFNIDAQIYCERNSYCTMVDSGVKLTDGSSVNTITLSKNRFGQFEFIVK